MRDILGKTWRQELMLATSDDHEPNRLERIEKKLDSLERKLDKIARHFRTDSDSLDSIEQKVVELERRNIDARANLDNQRILEQVNLDNQRVLDRLKKTSSAELPGAKDSRKT
jgi:flagellar biosynthesis/type III secretory pathway chaperone